MEHEMAELLRYRYERAVPRDIGRKISALSLIREQSDYNDFYVASKSESQQQIEIAEEIIALVKEYLRKAE